MKKKSKIHKMPRVYKRRLFDDDEPNGYLESFQDYANNNRPAVEWFLDNADAIRTALRVVKG